MPDRFTTFSGRRRRAQEPTEIPVAGLKDVMWRLCSALNKKRITLIAAASPTICRWRCSWLWRF